MSDILRDFPVARDLTPGDLMELVDVDSGNRIVTEVLSYANGRADLKVVSGKRRDPVPVKAEPSKSRLWVPLGVTTPMVGRRWKL